MTTRLLIIIGMLVMVSAITTNHAFAMCAYDPTHPNQPCDDLHGTLIIEPHEAQLENIDGKLYHVIGPFTLQRQSEDTIRLGDTEFTHPYYPVPIPPGGVMTVKITFSDGTKESIGRVGPPNPFVEFTEHEDPKAGVRRNPDGTFDFLLSVKQSISPLKQTQHGIYGNDIVCREDRVLVLKKSSELYSCITSETVPKLFARGWALNEVRIIDVNTAEQGKPIKIIGVIDRLTTPEGFEYHLIPLREELPRIEYTGYDRLNLFSTKQTMHNFLRNLEGKLVEIEGKFLLDGGEYFRHFSGFPTIPVEKIKIISDNENLEYSISGAKVLSIVKIPENAILNIVIQESQKGSLEITIPRVLFDVKIGGYDDDFFVLIDGEEVDFEETRNDEERILTIQFEENATTIQVIGTFPT